MSDKLLKILGAVLIVLVVLVALARWNASRPSSPTSAPVDLKSLKDSGVDRIVLASAEGSVTLTKSSAGWNVGASPAATSTVAAMWKTLDGATFGELVSTNPDNQTVFGLAGPTVRTLVFYEGTKKKAALTVGAQTDSPGSFYVKTGRSKNVWVVNAQLDTIPTAASAWRGKPAPTPPKAPSVPPKAPSVPPTQ